MSDKPISAPAGVTSPGNVAFYAMVFLSGSAALLYQILWMRQLGLLFGNTSHAVAVTLAVFFAGLAGGSWFWGNRSQRIASPLHTYALLEIGIAASASLYFLVPEAVQLLYPPLYRHIGPGAFLVLVNGLLAMLMILPPAFFMGGTIPVMGQFLIRNQAFFGAMASRIYGINTIGAACGAFTTGFVLVFLLGFRLTCATGIAVSLAIAALALLLAMRTSAEPTNPSTQVSETASAPTRKPENRTPKAKKKRERRKDQTTATDPLSRRVIHTLAFISGFSVLALEVLWSRLFAQVHVNSVYSFSSVLIVVLLSLALGALLASWLAGRQGSPGQTLKRLALASGILLCLAPFILMRMTDRFQMLPTDTTFLSYTGRLFLIAFAAMGPSCLAAGTLFPFLMKIEERFAQHPGESIGRLSAINTAGAILGSLLCGFVFLPWLGVWTSMQVITIIYLIAALLIPGSTGKASFATGACALLFLLLSFTLLSPSGLPVTGGNAYDGPESVVATWEGSDCTVSVVKRPDADDDYAIKINSNYSLGSTDAYRPQIFQSRLPLLTYPETASVFYLGMGTGVTAGEALNRNDFRKIREVVACELSPNVVKASKKYFTEPAQRFDLTNGLFTDPRARILVEDGRLYLAATDATYDMIIADLFLPYRSGAGSLYSLEHFKCAGKRLNPGGVFVQWLPLYQMTEFEFGVIARTMLSAFDQVTLWRNTFRPGSEVVALVGHLDRTPLPPCGLDMKRERASAVEGAVYTDMQDLLLPINEQTILFFYCGNVTGSRERFESYPVNTDDRPVIEYRTPRALHSDGGGQSPQFVATKFADLVDELLRGMPPASDPMLARRNPASRRLALAGAAFHRGWIARLLDDGEGWRRNWGVFLQHWTASDEPDQTPGN